MSALSPRHHQWLPVALALAACGSGGGSEAADARLASCDPLAQTGCDAGEKCSAVWPAEDGGDAVTECQPDGALGAGEPCELVPRPDGTRVDDCAAPLVCGPEGVCAAACEHRVRGSCGEEATCVAVNHLFEDVAVGRVGVCVPQCDPLDPAGSCTGDRGCYPFFVTGEFFCASPADGAAELGFMDECQPQSAPGTCFLNSAPVGAVSFLSLDWETQAQSTPRVSPFCRAISTHSKSADPEATAAGDPSLACGVGLLASGGAQCRHINSLYSNEELGLIPDGVGLCVPTGESSPAGSHYNDSRTFDLEAWAANPKSGLNPDGVPYCPGCLTRQELADALSGAGARLGDVAPRAGDAAVQELLEAAGLARRAP